jgi:hypothetical protein
MFNSSLGVTNPTNDSLNLVGVSATPAVSPSAPIEIWLR